MYTQASIIPERTIGIFKINFCRWNGKIFQIRPYRLISLHKPLIFLWFILPIRHTVRPDLPRIKSRIQHRRRQNIRKPISPRPFDQCSLPDTAIKPGRHMLLPKITLLTSLRLQSRSPAAHIQHHLQHNHHHHKHKQRQNISNQRSPRIIRIKHMRYLRILLQYMH